MTVNTVTFTAADGKSMSFPYDLLIEKNAVIASKVNGEDLSASVGGTNQLWIPGLPGKYFIRDIVKIDFTEEEVPIVMDAFEDDGVQFTNRPNVSIKPPAVSVSSFNGGPDEEQETLGLYLLGEPIRFEGYADDYDRAIVAVQFSLDQGKTWTSCNTTGAASGRWVYWHFEYTPLQAGSYLLKVRSVNDHGDVSPLAAVQPFQVVE